MDTVIKVTPKSAYGVERYYPANDLARRMADFVDQASLTQSQLIQLRAMGFEIQAEQAPSLDNLTALLTKGGK